MCIHCIGKTNTSQTEENTTSKYVLMQNDSVGNTAANNASMCENSIKIHDNMKQIIHVN